MPASVDKDPKGFGLASVTFTFLAAVLAFSSLYMSGLAWKRSGDAKSEALAAAGGTQVTLNEFSIEPARVEVGPDGVLTVTNAGKAEHDLVVTDTDKKTSLIEPGGTARLDLKGLEPGAYEIFCDVSGHKGAGMRADLHVGHGGAAAGAETTAQSNEAIDERIAERTKAFPAATEGKGAEPLQPTVLPDGTKQFDLTAQVVDWEVEPGKTVQAWTYNGTAPGPTIKVAVGDRVRVALTNELPESTSIHFHGITTPNSMDGVPDITQPPVKPGETFTYEFVASEPAVGIYHSHHHAEKQVPDGLFAPFIIGDPPVPAGVTVSQEVPMVLNDAGVIGLSLNGKSFPATAPISASLGEWVEIHYFNEGLQMHPMHLHGMPQLVIAKDGYPLPQPYRADTVAVAPGERYTVLVQATQPGIWAFHCHILNHAEREDGMFGMVTAFIVQ